MYLPVIQGREPEKKVIDAFGGLNRSFMVKDNEFSDMENMTGEDFPCLSVRPERKAIEDFTEDRESLDLIIEDYERKETYDKGTGIRIYDNTFDFYERGEKQETSKTVAFTRYDNETYTRPMRNDIRGLIRFGNNVICYPHPEVVNTIGGSKGSLWLGGDVHGYPEVNLSGIGARAFALSGDGPGYGVAVYSYKTSYRNVALKLTPGMRIRLEEYEYFTKSGTTSITMTGNDFGAAFFVVTGVREGSDGSVYDYLDLKGYRHDGTEMKETISYKTSHENPSLNQYNGTTVLITPVDVDANLLAVHQNRLWGTDTLGTSIYCSNATNFRDWRIDGTAAGGGYLDVPENTPWTAICEYAGYLYAFKVNRMYKIMGSNSLDYSIIQIADIGCTNHEAVCVCDSVLYFLARDGVYAFYGSQPACVSEALGGEYKWGHFASRGQKLYASLEHMDGKKEFLVYDTAKRMWHKEDDFSVRCFVDYADGLYALGEDKACYKLEGGAPGSDVPFSVTTKKYFYTFDEKAVSSVNLYLDMGEGSEVTVAVSYDGGEFVECGTFTNRRLKYIPVRLKKCDEFQLRISGHGFIRLKQMEFVVHGGGRDMR